MNHLQGCAIVTFSSVFDVWIVDLAFLCVQSVTWTHNSHRMHDREIWNGEFFQSLLLTEAIDSQGKLFPLSKYSVS